MFSALTENLANEANDEISWEYKQSHLAAITAVCLICAICCCVYVYVQQAMSFFQQSDAHVEKLYSISLHLLHDEEARVRFAVADLLFALAERRGIQTFERVKEYILFCFFSYHFF